MFPVSLILALFLYQLSVGCILTLALMPLEKVDQKFYQLSCGLSSILVSIALGISIYYPFKLPDSFNSYSENLNFLIKFNFGLFYGFLGLIFLIYIRMRRKQLKAAKFLVRMAALTGVAALAVQGLMYRPANLYGGLKSLVLPIDFVTAAWFLGVFMLAMVFGHWYLVTAMPKKLLRRMAELLILILVIRVLVVGGVFGIYFFEVPGGADALNTLMDLSQGHGLFFWQRVLIGLGIPLVLSYMIWSTAKIGANQSATGLLYVGVVFVIIGEMISKYMFMMSGIPI